MNNLEIWCSRTRSQNQHLNECMKTDDLLYFLELWLENSFYKEKSQRVVYKNVLAVIARLQELYFNLLEFSHVNFTENEGSFWAL